MNRRFCDGLSYGWRVGALLSLLAIAVGCIPAKRTPEEQPSLTAVVKQPLSPEETKALLKDAAGNWFYGQGVGDTMVQVGTIAVFPPYAILLISNAALSIGGYEPLGVSKVLPEEGKNTWDSFYNGLTSAPGRFTAAVAGREFITPKQAQQRVKQHLPQVP